MIRESEFKDAFDEGFAQSYAEGLNIGELIGGIRVCQQVLGLPETPHSELIARSEAESAALRSHLFAQCEQYGLVRQPLASLPEPRVVFGTFPDGV